MNPNPNDEKDTSEKNDQDRAQPSTGPLKNEPTPERAREEKLRQEREAEKKS